MISTDLLDIFRTLRASSDDNSDFIGVELNAEHGIYAACTSDKELAIILRDPKTENIPSRDLSSLMVDYGVTCSAVVSGKEIKEEAIVIKLKRGSLELEEAFSLFLSLALIEISESPVGYKPRELVGSLIQLFQSKPKESREAVIGFFGELTLIARSGNPEAWVAAWHANGKASKDYSFQSFHVEVKTTESRRRKHKLTLDQLNSSEKPVMMASIQVEEESTGKSVLNLINDLEDRLVRNSYRKVCDLFFETLGISNSLASELSFEVKGGTGGILIFDSVNIPAPRLPDNEIDAETIKSVEFESNFDLIMSKSLTQNKLWQAQNFQFFDETLGKDV